MKQSGTNGDQKSRPITESAFAYYYHRTDRLLRLHFTRLMLDFKEDVTVEQWILLNQFMGRKSVSQADLVDKTFNDRPNVTRLLDGLEKKGLVRRENDAGDRRKFSIVMTAKGKSLMDRTVPIMLEERKSIYKGLSDADLKTLKRISGTIESNIMRTRPPV